MIFDFAIHLIFVVVFHCGNPICSVIIYYIFTININLYMYMQSISQLKRTQKQSAVQTKVIFKHTTMCTSNILLISLGDILVDGTDCT